MLMALNMAGFSFAGRSSFLCEGLLFLRGERLSNLKLLLVVLVPLDNAIDPSDGKAEFSETWRT